MNELLQPHPQAEWLIAMAQGKPVQRFTAGGLWVGASLNCLCNYPSGTFRIKPETININGHEVPSPVREPLNYGTHYFMVSIGDASYTEHTWRDQKHDFRWLKYGQIQLTREGAIAQAKAMIAACGGETRSDK